MNRPIPIQTLSVLTKPLPTTGEMPADTQEATQKMLDGQLKRLRELQLKVATSHKPRSVSASNEQPPAGFQTMDSIRTRDRSMSVSNSAADVGFKQPTRCIVM